jgi:zinc/manganese transport system substrate-binding protein
MFGDALVDEVGGEKLVRLAESGALETYLSEQSLEGQLSGWMGMSKKLGALEIVTYHTTWAYFGKRFGISIPIHIEEKPGIAPSAKHRDAVVALVEEREIAAIVTTTFYDDRAVDYVAERTGTPVLVLPVEPSDEIGDRSYAGLIDHIFRKLSGLAGAGGDRSQ